jgi:diguanylate cyclase (GGDEF)-like protein
MRRRFRYLINGVILALGAPLGLLALHAATHAGPLTISWLEQELHARALDYAYLTSSTITVFAILGLRLGTREEQLQNSALTDPLTGLWNRRLALNRLAEELARAKRYGQPLSVLFIDVDWLKQINDKGGHSAGDDALRKVADAIRSSCRVVDIAARYGGDEYMVIASNTTATDGVSLGERIRAAIKSSSGNTISVSIGVADLTALKQVDVTTLCQAADEALYQAKLQGRNRVALSQPPPANPGAA